MNNTVYIVALSNAHAAYKAAADAFIYLAGKVSGASVETISDTEAQKGLPSDCKRAVILGSDAVNHFAMELYFAKKLDSFNLRYCTDDYTIRTFTDGGREFLLLAGGRPRAAIYAVYRYFELYCGCRYFWDGDRIPAGELPFENINVSESPRFEYRGLRYFAHRSLHRFQAEHWSLADWEREIDWILKKRLNMFMLRIGLDDLFQKAFPDDVSYPDRDKKLPEAGGGYDDRTLFWSLEYRGELRKKLLTYAFERDLMHPEDCGTMTHWYSRTPLEFLEKQKPTLLSQKSCGYSEQTGLVWDIKDDKNLRNYFKLTETHVREYGRPELFHTIGLAERSYSDDREENLRLKLYVYHRISSYLAEKYPNTPLMIASWDLWMFYTPEEVRKLVSELNPAQSIILDYTSDTTRDSNFTNWGVVGKFPWIFGIFSGYESNSEMRGYYELTNERLITAKADQMCKGLILWPELSHGDTLIGEYLAENAWDNETKSVNEIVGKFCADRYSPETRDEMLAVYSDFMPIAESRAWSMDKSFAQSGNDKFVNIIPYAKFTPDRADKYDAALKLGSELKSAGVKVLRALVKICAESKTENPDSEFLRRDICDIARCVLGRFVDFGIMQSEKLFALHADGLTDTLDLTEALNKALCGVLSSHEDFSLFDSLNRLRAVTETNPDFETTLKNNASNGYCRSYIYENARFLYIPEMKLLFDEVRTSAASGTEPDRKSISAGYEANLKAFFAYPLAEMDKAEKMSISEALTLGADTLEKIIF